MKRDLRDVEPEVLTETQSRQAAHRTFGDGREQGRDYRYAVPFQWDPGDSEEPETFDELQYRVVERTFKRRGFDIPPIKVVADPRLPDDVFLLTDGKTTVVGRVK